MNKSMYLYTKLCCLFIVPLFVVACVDGQVDKDKVEDALNKAAEKSVEFYEEAAPVVEKAAKDAAEKSVEFYEEAAPVVEKAAKDAAAKGAELYEEHKEEL